MSGKPFLNRVFFLLLLALLCLLFEVRAEEQIRYVPEETRMIVSIGTPIPLPTCTPEPTPTPTPTSTPVPTPSPTPEPTPVKKLVALTFDDGPNSKVTPKVLDILAEYDVKATFFLIGTQISGNAAVIKRIAEEGHEIGCHTWNHGNMTKQSVATQEKGLKKWRQALEEVLGVGYPVTLLRPPGGSCNNRAKTVAANFGCAVVLWSVDTMDWSNKSRSKILSICKKNTKEGGIILMHDRIAATAAALPDIIEYLQGQGYTLVTVTELLSRFGTEPEKGKAYRSMPAEQ